MPTTALASDQSVIDLATHLLRHTYLSAQNQLTLEHAIGLVAIHKNCTRAHAAQILHNLAWNSR